MKMNGYGKTGILMVVAILCGCLGWFTVNHCQQDDLQTSTITDIRISLATIGVQLERMEEDRKEYWRTTADTMKKVEERLVSLELKFAELLSREAANSGN